MRVAAILLACCLCALGGAWVGRRARAADVADAAGRPSTGDGPLPERSFSASPASEILAAPAPPAARPEPQSAASRRVLSPEAPSVLSREQQDAFDALLAEVRQVQGSGQFQFRIQLVRGLLYAHLNGGRLAEARSVLERYRPEQSDLYVNLARRLKRKDRLQEALDVLGLGAQVLPEPSDLAKAYLELDPTRSVELLRAKIEAQEGSGFRSADRLALAQALERAGDAAAAIGTLQALIDEGLGSERTFGELLRLDPLAAERELRRARAGERAEPWVTFLLARTLGRLERADEGFGLLEEAQRFGPRPDEALEQMCLCFPERAFDYLSGIPDPVDPDRRADLWSQVADGLAERGEQERACEAWLRVAEVDPTWLDEESVVVLARRRPAALLDALRAWTPRPADRRDDEVWGDFGDLAWRAGGRSLALEGWERAAALDPGDEEWTEKLAAAGQGRDPLE